MSAFKIDGSLFRPAPGISGSKKTEKDSAGKSAAPSMGGFDRTSFNRNPLAVMPRMSTVGGQNAQHVQGETVETMLRDSAAELDDYFTKAYGFDENDR